MSHYKKHLDAFHRIYDSVHPRSRKAFEQKRHPDGSGKFHEQPTHHVPDETRVQAHEAGPADYNFNDAKRDWTRGYGKPHPHFDHSGPSGRRYDKGE